MKNELYYYELCFYHYEDLKLQTEDSDCFCIKTEIPNISKEDAIKILYHDKPIDEEFAKNLTAVYEMSEKDAYDNGWDSVIEGLTERYESPFGVYYLRPDEIPEKTENTVYKEFDFKCRQLGLSEVFKTKSKSTYEWMLEKLRCRKAKGYGDDWNCIFEIRFR